ncbi:glycosyltransferase [Halobacteriovorax marinus]|uniref:glycosyltransferase n=1 Tax=Halobacteriovorax marinus TaxID=97084 RepID=UPI003A958962
MTEIIPEIEKLWSEVAHINGYETLELNVDHCQVKDVISKALQADLILATCFNLKVSWAIKLIRMKLELSTPIKFYVHGMATVGLWPLAYWEWNLFWGAQDSFIVSCKRDVSIIEEKFPNANVELIPFSYECKSREPNEHEELRFSFYYVGRVSEQKNLHSLIFSFSRHLEKYPDSVLSIFGGEDTLGSPNMGISSIDYISMLERLGEDLGISESIYFKGFVPRGEIQKRIESGRKVFISTSLHSDENFGMAVLEALNHGHKAIISNWGGFADFKEQFSNQVRLVDVHQSEVGPFIDIEMLIEEMSLAVDEHGILDRTEFYQRRRVARKIAINSLSTSEEVCDFSFAKEIVKIKNSYSTDTLSTKIFSSYSDVYFHYFSERYGGFIQERRPKSDNFTLLPWVKMENDGIVTINDPHRGKIRLELRKEEGMMELFKLGYAISE